MNYKQLILSAIRGIPTDQIPFVPRLDLWYKANSQGGTLPDKYKNSTLKEITEDMDVGYHAIVPDFRDFLNEDDDADLGLGIHRFKTMPYTVELHNVEREVSRNNGITTVSYTTPYGVIKTRIQYDESMSLL